MANRHYRKLRLFVLIASIMLLIELQVVHAQSGSPFIYYYSPLEQVFIIERADGSDRRIFANYSLPPTHTSIEGAGWSYSGEWFAWMSRPNGTGGAYTNTIHLFNYPEQRLQSINIELGNNIV